MAESAQARRDPPEIAEIQDADVRRAIRAIYRDLHEAVQRQQVLAEVLLEVLLDKNLTSMGELKRHVARTQQGGERIHRIHEQLTSLTQQPRSPGAPAAPQR
jgi:hypothetical protein